MTPSLTLSLGCSEDLSQGLMMQLLVQQCAVVFVEGLELQFRIRHSTQARCESIWQHAVTVGLLCIQPVPFLSQLAKPVRQTKFIGGAPCQADDTSNRAKYFIMSQNHDVNGLLIEVFPMSGPVQQNADPFISYPSDGIVHCLFVSVS